MKISEQGLALIRRFEGFSATAYRCPAGRMTIGYGHVILPGERYPETGISEPQAANLLRDDVRKAELALSRYVQVPLTQNQADALISFIYNIGAGAFARSTLRRVVNRGWHAEVPAQLRRWVFADGRALQGLVVRRAAEALMYMGEEGP